jgi:predicted ATPase
MMLGETRIHRVVFASGDNPMSTIEFVENRGINLFEDFSEERKEFDPSVIINNNERNQKGYPSFPRIQHNIQDGIDFNLPVLIGGKNSSGKTSLLRAIELVCELLNEPEISKTQASDTWGKMKAMNVSYFQMLFSTTITSLCEERDLSFAESLTQIIMNSTDQDKTLKWCDGIQIRNPNYNISESEMYSTFGEFRPPKRGKSLPEYKTTIGKHRIEKLLSKLVERHDNSILKNEIISLIERLKISEYKQQEIYFQKTIFIDVDRKNVDKWLSVNKEIPIITERYDKLSTNPNFLKGEIVNISQHEWFSLIYGPAKNVIEQTKNGSWKTIGDEPEIISEIQSPYTGWDTMPDWWRFNPEFAQKSDAINFLTEGALLDIMSWLTGKPQLERGINIRTNKWVDADLTEPYWQYGGEREYEKGKGERDIPLLHIALKNPVVRRLLMDQKNDLDSKIDILTRMNFFTPLQDITTQYLTSGQRQVLALIIAVREAEQGSLILIDEPEISLHVDWQSALVEQLHAPLTGSQLVIATHSPDITMNHLHLCNVLLTKNEDGDL